MKINFNKPIIILSGEPIMEGEKPVLLGKTIANALIMMTKGDALKYLGWAQKMYDGESVEMDDSDIEIFKGFINESTMITVLVKGQALQVIREAREEREKFKVAN